MAATAAAAFDAAWDALFTHKGTLRQHLGTRAAFSQAADALLALQQMRLQHNAHVDHAAMRRLA